MHELSIAISIIDMVQEEAEHRHASRVEAIHLKLGPLSGVVREALEASYEIAAEDTPLKGTRLVIENVPVVVYCSACDQQQQLESIQNFTCPACGSPTPDVIHGKELEVVSMEIIE